jgi:hypothetical protein
LGLAENTDKLLCSVLKTGEKAYLAVWRRDGEEENMEIPLNNIWEDGDIQSFKVSLAYPEKALAENCSYIYDEETGRLKVSLKQSVMARMFVIER